MAVDIVPELYNRIETSFRSRMNKDAIIRTITRKIGKGNAALNDAQTYAERIGVNISGALRENLTANTLPNSILYYNIADRTVRPLLETGYELANETATAIQSAANAKKKIGIKPVSPEFNKQRIDGLINMMCASDIELEDALKWLGEPIINNSMAFYDDFVEANAKVADNVGLQAKIERNATWGACAWCLDLEGKYDYGDHPDDVFRRHENCRCTVTYTNEKGKRQDSWSKKWYNNDRDQFVEARKREQEDRELTDRCRQIMRKRTHDGTYSLELSRQKFDEHIAGTPQYNNTAKMRGEDPSRLLVSYEQAQVIINTYSGTGTPVAWDERSLNIEYVTTPYYIGEFQKDGEWIKTRRFAIHHGKNGSHIVPVNPEYGGRYYG